jgi:Ca-activated chloride channel family protein
MKVNHPMSRKTGLAAGVAAGFWFFTQIANGAQGPVVEVPVPGGVKALAAISHCDRNAGYGDILVKYSKALIHYTESDAGLDDYAANLREYFAAVAELAKIAEQHGDQAVVSLSLGASPEKTARALDLFGWKVVRTRRGPRLELADGKRDGPRQEIPDALGIDALVMQQTLERGGTFRFELETGRARLNGGDLWSEYAERARRLPGGLFEAFANDLPLAKAYVALSAAPPATTAALIKGIGLRALVERHANVLALYGKSLEVKDGAAVVPGGEAAEPAWTRLTGASPHNPPAFFRGLLEKDLGKLAAFYSAIAGADAAHQRFFTSSAETLARFYKWYRDSEEFSAGATHPAGTWRARMFRELPLDQRKEWPASESLEAPLAIATLAKARKAPFDERSAALIEEHFNEWRPLLPYFEALPALGAAEFESLAACEQALRGYDRARREVALGDWYSLVDLIALGERAGSLDPAAGALAFRRACEACRQPHLSAAALDVLKSIGAGSVEDVETLLGLSAQRREAFDRIMDSQQVPRLADVFVSNDEDKTLVALSGLVYAAHLDRDALLVVEDPLLLRKHRFSDPKRDALFLPARLEASSEPPGSRFTGGFAHFEEAARRLARTGGIPAARLDPRTDEEPGSATDPGPVPEGGIFHAQARLVEVYATVTDGHGRKIDGLPVTEFKILDEGVPQRVAAFEPELSAVSCALVLDVTGSMEASLASMRKTAFQLIDALRPADSVAVFAFNQTVSALQPFTTDKNAAKRAVLGAHLGGVTALYDALARVSRAISGRSGKKVIVVVTDGSDNNSVLTAGTAIRRAKNTGAAIYTIAEGVALNDNRLVERLADIAAATGGLPFVVENPKQMRRAAQAIAADLAHGYLFAFEPAPGGAKKWHRIQVLVEPPERYKVRAREGYYPE